MTAAYTRNMNQVATYWAPGARDKYSKITLAAPVKILCRWQNKAEVATGPDGKEFTSSAVVYPNQALLREGWLYLGESAATDPRTVSGALEIKQIGSSPSLRNTLILHKVWL